jgi:hypothetical protein
MLVGCSGLILRDTDSTGDKVGKVAARVLLCPVTICLSEAAIIGIKSEEERYGVSRSAWPVVPDHRPFVGEPGSYDRKMAWAKWQLQRYGVDDPTDAYAAELVRLMDLKIAGKLSESDLQTLRDPIIMAPPPSLSVHCTTSTLGIFTNTDCYQERLHKDIGSKSGQAFYVKNKRHG